MSSKRKLDSFFQPAIQKKPRHSPEPLHPDDETNPGETSKHATYPFPIPHLPQRIVNDLASVPASEGREINDQPDLDLVYFQPFIPPSVQHDLFEFLRNELFFYRVQYTIKRDNFETQINTPRYTTVFGVDSSSQFTDLGNLIGSQTSKPVPRDRYSCQPRPLPQCLRHLCQLTEIFTSATYNFCLVNYYANGADGISYHSDDERFLGPDPSRAEPEAAAEATLGER